MQFTLSVSYYLRGYYYHIIITLNSLQSEVDR